HLFWHAIYVEMISADLELMRRYGYGEEPHSDALGNITVLHDVRGRNEIPRDFAAVVDGVLNIDVLNGTTAFAASIRRIFLDVVAEHPWLVIRSFLIGKPNVQYQMYTHVPMLWKLRSYAGSFAMALAAVVLALMAGLGPPDRSQLLRGLAVL